MRRVEINVMTRDGDVTKDATKDVTRDVTRGATTHVTGDVSKKDAT